MRRNILVYDTPEAWRILHELEQFVTDDVVEPGRIVVSPVPPRAACPGWLQVTVHGRCLADSPVSDWLLQLAALPPSATPATSAAPVVDEADTEAERPTSPVAAPTERPSWVHRTYQERQRERLENAMLVRNQRRTIHRAAVEQQQPPTPPTPRPPSYDWANTTFWTTPDGSYPIAHMTDAYLWETLIWLVRHREDCAHTAEIAWNTRQPRALQVCYWLRTQPVFRALLREAVRRRLTFPDDVYTYFRQYVLDRVGRLDDYQPWRDPAHAGQATDLQPFLAEPLVPEVPDVCKEERYIELGPPEPH